MAVNLHSTHYRFGIDELAESTHGWHANEDANPAQGVIAVNTNFLLRFTVQETGGTIASNVDNQFQCNLNGGAYQDITTTSTIVKAVAVAAFANGADCTKRLSGTGTFETTAAGCTEDGLSGGNTNDIAASGNSETECGLQIVGADVVNGDVIRFRLTSPDFTITNDVVPTLTVAESFTVTPGIVALTIATFAPVVTATANILVTAGVLSLVLSTFAPTVTISDPNITVTPSPATLTTSAFAPSVTASDHKIVIPELATIAISTLAPTIAVSDHQTVIPATTSLVFTGYLPTVSVSGGVVYVRSVAAIMSARRRRYRYRK